MNSSPSLTVLMPVYNAGPHIREAIESILAQTHADFELLIIDDGSKDDSAATISSYTDARIRFVRNEQNLGLIATLNKGLAEANGELIARMDQDDIALPERLALQLAAFRREPDLIALGTSLTLMNVRGKTVGELPVLTGHEQIKRALAVTNPFAHPSMMFKRAAALEVGGYHKEAYATEDYDLWTRLSDLGPVANLKERLLRYRLNPKGMSISLRTAQRENAAAIAEREWAKYGQAGPAPTKDWDSIWPSRRGLDGAARLNYANLHLLFAKGYRKRGAWFVCWAHAMTAVAWAPFNRSAYFALLMFVMPYDRYYRLEERIAGALDHVRAG